MWICYSGSTNNIKIWQIVVSYMNERNAAINGRTGQCVFQMNRSVPFLFQMLQQNCKMFNYNQSMQKCAVRIKAAVDDAQPFLLAGVSMLSVTSEVKHKRLAGITNTRVTHHR